VLLIDEVLAVGDASFQQKCFDVFNRLRDEGKTIVLVTHDMGAVTRFCHRALLLEHGDIVVEGDPEDVANHYLELNFNRDGAAPSSLEGMWSGNGAARIVDLWCETPDGMQPAMYLQGSQLRFCARVEFVDSVEDPGLTVVFENDDKVQVLVASTSADEDRPGSFSSGETAVFSIEFTNVLAPGRYMVIASLSRLGHGLELIDRSDRELSIVVQGSRAQGGVVDLPVSAAIERSPAGERRHAEAL
jgi:hypothetical protein